MSEAESFFEPVGNEAIDYKGLLVKYLQYWYLFLAGVVLSLSISFLHIRYNTITQYYIDGTILIKDDQSGSGIGGSSALMDLDMFASSKNIENEIILLKSRSLMERVLTELSYNITYYKKGRVNDVEIFSGRLPFKLILNKVSSEAFNKTLIIRIQENNSLEIEERSKEGSSVKSYHKFGHLIKKPYAQFTIEQSIGSVPLNVDEKFLIRFHNTKLLAEYYSKRLNIVPVNKKASVLAISLMDPVSEKGINIINKLIEVYEKEEVEDKNIIASQTLHFIDERLQYLTTELSNVEKNVEQYKKQNGLTDVGSDAQLYVSNASEYNKKLADIDIQLELLNSIETYLQQQGAQFEMVPSTLNIENPSLVNLIAKFNDLQLQKQRLLRASQADHPLVININEQMASLRTNIRENLRVIKNGLNITRQNLITSSSKFENKKRQVPAMERELLEINRQQGVKEGLYLYLLQKREESAITLAATVSNSKIIDAPSAGEPIGPKSSTIYLMALLLGIGVPFAGIYIKEMINDKVQKLVDVEKLTTTPIIGEIIHNSTGEIVVVKENSNTTIAELFRLIRSNIQFAMMGKVNKIVLVTSSMSGEGKTFFSINIGSALAQTGKKVLVLEFDLRLPNLTKDLGLSKHKGVTNYLSSEKIDIDDIIQPFGSIPGLFLMNSGPIPPNPAAFMTNPKVGQLMSMLKENFDHIIIDTAPVGQVADAFSLAAYIDSTIYLVRYNFTSKTQISIIQEIYRNKKLKNPMIVLNGASMLKNKYGYGYEYSKDNKKKHVKTF
jgi:capsular exopolysaccharide synthesis family protein